MSTETPRFTHTKAWQALHRLADGCRNDSIDKLQQDENRARAYSLSSSGLTLDYSRHLLDDGALHELLELAKESEVGSLREALF
ncbi:MAG: hypothetical protein ACI9GW_003284, partial [Halieaceae bacterium]